MPHGKVGQCLAKRTGMSTAVRRAPNRGRPRRHLHCGQTFLQGQCIWRWLRITRPGRARPVLHGFRYWRRPDDSVGARGVVAAPVVPAYSTLTTTNLTVPMVRRAPILGVMERASERLVRLPNDASADRRANIRFPLTQEVRYVVSGRRAPVGTGSGRIIDLSSSGLSFTADRPLLTGQKLEVSIDWPAPLDGGVKLQLTITGVVVRTNGTATALEILGHEFRTRRVGPKAAPPQESVG